MFDFLTSDVIGTAGGLHDDVKKSTDKDKQSLSPDNDILEHVKC